MATPHRPPPAARKALKKLGLDIKEARLRRRLPMDLVAERASTSRPTVARVEKGDPSVSIGIYASVLQAIGLLKELADVADIKNDPSGQAMEVEALPKRARLPRRPR